MWLRGGAAVTAIIISLFILAHITQVVLAYHYLTTGNHLRDEALTRREQSAAAWQAYQRSIDIAEIELLGLISTHTPGRSPGIPRPHEFIWLQAQNGKAAMSSQLGDYETAINTYTLLLQVTDEPAKVYAERAIAYQSLAAVSSRQTDAYMRAIEDYNEAIRRDPTNADYYLWRGVAYHSLGNPAQAAVDYLTALDGAVTDGLNQQGRSQALSGLRWLQDR
jgi:tetratricopeptide (TPR) repeat protein